MAVLSRTTRPACPPDPIKLGDQHGGSCVPVVSEVVERDARLVQRPPVHRRLDPHRGGEPEDLLAVPTGVRRDAADLLLEEQLPLVVERRDVGEMDPGQYEDAAPVERTERERHIPPAEANRITASSGSGGPVLGVAGARHAVPSSVTSSSPLVPTCPPPRESSLAAAP
jgi:hypothetical protein